MNDISIDKPQPLPLNSERFLIDSDIDPELVFLLRKVGLKATHATWHDIPNDDTGYLVWARNHGYILVNHDKHRDAKTKYSFYSEMYYRGGRVIRVGKPGQATLRLLGCILAQHHKWSAHFATIVARLFSTLADAILKQLVNYWNAVNTQCDFHLRTHPSH